MSGSGMSNVNIFFMDTIDENLSIFSFFVDRCRRVRYYEIKRIFYEWKWRTFDEIEDNNGSTGGRRSPTTR